MKLWKAIFAVVSISLSAQKPTPHKAPPLLARLHHTGTPLGMFKLVQLLNEIRSFRSLYTYWQVDNWHLIEMLLVFFDLCRCSM